MGSLGALLCKPYTGLSRLIATFQTTGRAHMACVLVHVSVVCVCVCVSVCVCVCVCV